MRVRDEAKRMLHQCDMIGADLGIDNSYDPWAAWNATPGEEHPIHWVRMQEPRMKELKRLRRISNGVRVR